MNRNNNILTKILMLLTLTVGWGGSAWAAYVDIVPSPHPTASRFVAGTNWYTIQFNGNDSNHGVGTDSRGSYMNADVVNGSGLMLWGSTEGDTDAAKWCFVPQSDGKYLLYNKKKGPSYVLGIENPTAGGNQNIIFYDAATAPEASTHFESVTNTAKAGNTLRVNTRVGINNSGGVVKSYQHGSNAATGANFSMTLTLVETVPDGYRIIIDGDSDVGYTVTTTADVNSGTQTAKHNQYLNLTNAVAANDLRSLSIDAPSNKVVWGPVVDNEDMTITFEVSDPVAPQAGKWYKVQVLPTNGVVTTASTGNLVTSLNDNIKGEAIKSNYMYLQNAPSPSNRGNYQSIHWFMGMPQNEAAGYIYVTSFNSNNIMFQHINGRYIGNDGKQQTGVNNGSDVLLTLSNQGEFTNCYSWKHLRPWVLDGNDMAPYVGRASNSTNNFYSYFAEVDPTEKYDVYQVNVQGGNANTTINYVGDASNSHGLNNIYNGGYLFFRKGYVPQSSDFTTNISFENQEIETSGVTGIRQLLIKDSDSFSGFSPTPTDGQWADGTKWFTWRSNRNNQNAAYNRRYVDVIGASTNDSYYIDLSTQTAPTTRGGYWCFVGNNTTGFQIQNAAYGPDFVFAYLGNNNFQMVHKSEIPSGAATTFTLDSSTVLEGAAKGYTFRIGTSGTNHVHHTNGTLIAWDNGSNGHPNTSDTGSSFQITPVDDATFNATAAYTAYKVVVQPEGLSVNIPVSFEYTPVGQLGAKSAHHASGHYILIQQDVTPESSNFTSDMVPDGFTNLTRTTSTTNPAYEIITLTGEVVLPYVVHRPNGNVWRAKRNGYNGSASNTVGTQTADYTEVRLADNSTVKLQHTGVFEITHFLAPGETRELWMPSTSSSANGSVAKIVNYMRWFDYQTESMPDPDIVNLAADQNGSLYNNAWYYQNGIVVGAGVNGVYPKRFVHINMPSSLTKDQTDYEYTLANEATRYGDFGNNFTSGGAATGNASYLGSFTDPNGKATGNKNLLEPTIGTRQIYHLRSAHEMASKLSACTGDKWLEEETITFPTRSTSTGGYKDVIPLDYNFIDYWAYNAGGELRSVKQNGTTIRTTVDANGTGISIVSANCNDYLSGSQVFVEANSWASRDAGHYISFDYPSGGVITLPTGETSRSATIYVRLNVDGVEYNIKKFTIVFQNGVEAIPYYEVLGDPEHARSDKSLATQFGKTENPSGVYTQLNFHYDKKYVMGAPGAGLSEANGYYAFPYNFDEVSYSYKADGAQWVDWGEYGMRNDAQTATHASSSNPYFLSVNYLRELYKKKNAEAELAAAQTLLAGAGDDEVQRAEAEYRISEANKLLSEVTTATLQEAYEHNYYIYVDASEQPGQVGRLRINEPLCTGTRIYGTAWLSCATAYTKASPDPASVIFRFKGVRNDGTMTTIYSYCPGQISNIARDKNRNEVYGYIEQKPDGTSYNEALWQQVAFSFVNPYPATEFEGFVLEVFNNCRGSSGGDIFLDDIRLYIKTPQVNVDNAAPICGDELSIVRISTDFDAMMDALQGNTHLGEPTTYYGTYAILDKEVYDNHLAGIASPTTADVAEAFNKALMGETDKSKCTIGGKFLPELYAFHDIKFYSDYLSHEHITYSTLVGDNILETAGYMYQYNNANEIIARNLVFNCKITDERIAGKKYYLVFQANVTPHDMSSVSNYADFFSMGDPCCVRSEFQTMRATMVKVNGEEELDPYGIDYCPGTAPTISLNSYGYNINGEIIQEHGVYYDWYFGTKEQFKTERVWLDGADIDIDNINNYTHREILTAEDFCMEHCLMNFRHFYPNAGVNELYDGTVQVHHFEKDDETDTEYELTEKMIAKLKEWVEAGKLRLHLTAVSVDLGAHNAQGDTHILAIQQGAKLRYEHGDTSKQNPILYCIDPVEISFHTNLEAPGASVGLAGVDYSVTPYDRDVAGSGVYHSLPLRINNVQIDAIRQGKELEVPIRVILPSGYYKVNDGAGLVNTHRIHLNIDDADNDIYVAETNDPQWQLRSIDGSGGEYLPSVGKLLRIDANKERTEGYDLMIIQFNDATHDNQIRFVPREGYYYVLRTQFTENINPGVTLAPEYTVPEVKCKGNILIPLKIVPEYMKWTGRESNDWNNDRNWIRADYRDLVPSDAQNLSQAYANYETNTANSEAYTRQRRYNGLPESANDNVANDAKKDIYIPMDMPSASSLYNTFAYAPMVETSVIIPSDAEPYPVVTAHPKTAENLVRLTESGDGTNTPWIAYDMVSVRQPDGNYMAERYYENKINNITFEPASQLVNAQHLTYNKAWVEYELKTGRWYTLASPLQNTFAGEWYSPTAGGKQQTPQFYDITYQQGGGSQNLNDRFRPAYYQRSWDNKGNELVYTKTGNDYSYYIAADWSHVYNDVTKEYSNGGFSVMVEDGYMGSNAPADGKALVRLPKADKKYTYFDIDGSTGQKEDDTLPIYTQDATGAFILNQGAQPSKLFTDKLKTAGEFTQTITNETAGNNFFLVGNPFMANLDMDEFFAQNTQLEKKFWIMTEDGQAVSVKVDGSQWVGTTGSKVAPLQGFFVKGTGNTTTIRYTADMQSEPTTTAPLKAKGKLSSALQTLTIQAKHNGMTTTAIVALSEDASVDFVSNEDCETFIDSNTADQPTIYTVASGQAMTVNTVPAFENIPVGIVGEAEGSIEVTFSGFEDTLYLYDSVSGTRTELNDGTTVTMEGNTTGRYFITSAATGVDMATEDKQAKVKKGVWTISGIYCGETTQGVRPGLYIVDGVRMMIR